MARKAKTSARRGATPPADPTTLRAKWEAAEARARRCAEAERRVREELRVYREEATQQTEQLVEANEALESSHERYVSLYDYAPLAFVSLDHNGVIDDVNLAAADLLGAERERLIKLPLLNFVDPGSRRPLLDHMIRCRRKEVPAQTELVLRPRSGAAVPILLATWFGVPRGEIGWEFRSAMIDLTDRRLAEAQEASYQKRLSSLASELSLAQERERRRIAVEIHDNLSQNLALIKMKISMLRSRAEPPEVREALGEVTDLLDPVLERTRSLTFELSPPVLYELGLDEALEWLCERMARQHHMVVRFEGPASGGAGSHAPVPHDVAVLLFQAARELLMNVVKHARARRTTVRSSRGEGRATIMVADDGAGFDTAVLAGPGRGRRPAGASPNGDDGGDGTRGPGNGACGPDHDDLRGFGLFSIRTRLDHLGGRIDIRSGPGEGTVVTLTVPLAADPEPAAVALPADRNHYGPRGVVRRTHVSRRHPQANPDETRTPAPPPPREQNRTSASLKRSKNP